MTRVPEEAYGKVIVLGAGCLESTRILLNSKNEQYPNGLANSSGVLGKYFCEQIMASDIMGVIPKLRGDTNRGGDAKPDGAGIYIPRFRNLKDKQRDFIRGYGFEGGGGSSEFPGFARKIPGFGAKFKEEVKKNYAAVVSIGSFGEILARPENFVELDPVVRDAWRQGRKLAVHGWIYGLRDGLLRDLGLCVTGEADLAAHLAGPIISSPA